MQSIRENAFEWFANTGVKHAWDNVSEIEVACGTNGYRGLPQALARGIR
jgi:hypothetical protein